MHLHAGHNLIGYLPESEVLCSGNWEGTQNYMIDVLLWDADSTFNEERSTELASAAEDLNLNNGPEWGITVGNISYWITQSVEEDCAEQD